MPNVSSRRDPDRLPDRLDDIPDPLGGPDSRAGILRCRIAFYRQHLRQSSDVEFAVIYARELTNAQRALADLLEQGNGDEPP